MALRSLRSGMADTDDRHSAMEYERHTDSYFDPFAELYNVTAPAGA